MREKQNNMDRINNSIEYLDPAGKKINQAIESIFKISTGALALSITFRNSLTDCSRHLWLLSIAWILLCVVPISYVLLRLTEAQQDLFWWQKHRDAEDAFAEGKETKPMSELPREFKIKILATKLCYCILLISFASGIISFLLFAILNNRANNALH